ncbi:DUF2484 family protein [uncultured Roseovarius sp.]|uniref:DUF2484 family protein n=1 Tax=uncultured Roseovarius sp. TaxID=293344 RepID=UPI002600E116|nr:DUF2484 family protein [uncultured Roseovarius sp.]
MTLSVVLACLWIILANILGMIPSRDNHWRRAYMLIALGIPLLVFVIYQNGPWWGLAFLIAAMSVLRWPVVYLGRWLRARVGL